MVSTTSMSYLPLQIWHHPIVQFLVIITIYYKPSFSADDLDHKAQMIRLLGEKCISCLRLATPPYPTVLGHPDNSLLQAYLQRWWVLATKPTPWEREIRYHNCQARVYKAPVLFLRRPAHHAVVQTHFDNCAYDFAGSWYWNVSKTIQWEPIRFGLGLSTDF